MQKIILNTTNWLTCLKKGEGENDFMTEPFRWPFTIDTPIIIDTDFKSSTIVIYINTYWKDTVQALWIWGGGGGGGWIIDCKFRVDKLEEKIITLAKIVCTC